MPLIALEFLAALSETDSSPTVDTKITRLNNTLSVELNKLHLFHGSMFKTDILKLGFYTLVF